MAEADLDVVIRSLGKTQHKALMNAAKKRHARLVGLAAKAKNKETKARYKELAKNTLALAGAAARRMQITAENAADSYARSIQKAAEENPAKKIVNKKAVKKEKS
jgi:1-aminocyclopropane-1-carboxylate deaminase/D-cysteine desulfhydrase-like pyridoxal-dependent ACC family enzyme